MMVSRLQDSAREGQASLPRHIVVLGVISLLTAASSAMIYGLLPVFLVRVMGVTMASVGLIEGLAEAATSLAKIGSGLASDWIGRRKPLVLLGYAVSAVNKVLFPLAGDVSVVLAARVIDRIGKGMRDAPRDAFLADVTPAQIWGSGFGLRIAFYTTGFVIGPLTAIALMTLSGDNFRLVFWIALIPAVAAIVVLLFGIKERPRAFARGERRLRLRLGELARFPGVFWWAVATASFLSLARFSLAFLVLKAHHIGVDAAFVPIMLVVMHLVYAAAAYPFGVLADRADRRLQLGLGAVVLICADLVLACADAFWMTA
jgi:MFS family permease